MLHEDQVPKKIHEVPVVDAASIERYIEDMSMAEVGFCREDILASTLGKNLDFVWDIKVPDASSEAILVCIMRSLHSRQALGHG